MRYNDEFTYKCRHCHSQLTRFEVMCENCYDCEDEWAESDHGIPEFSYEMYPIVSFEITWTERDPAPWLNLNPDLKTQLNLFDDSERPSLPVEKNRGEIQNP
jgi:hypothetical protein